MEILSRIQNNARLAQVAGTGIAVGTTVGVAVNGSGILTWESTDTTRMTNGLTATSSNAFLSMELLPYYIGAAAVFFILGKMFGIFKFGGGKSAK